MKLDELLKGADGKLGTGGGKKTAPAQDKKTIKKMRGSGDIMPKGHFHKKGEDWESTKVNEAADGKVYVVIKVGFDHGDNDRQGFAYAVSTALDQSDAEELLKKADSIDWEDNDDHVHHMAQNKYGSSSASHGYTESAKIVKKEPEGAAYFGGYRPQDFKFNEDR